MKYTILINNVLPFFAYTWQWQLMAIQPFGETPVFQDADLIVFGKASSEVFLYIHACFILVF